MSPYAIAGLVFGIVMSVMALLTGVLFAMRALPAGRGRPERAPEGAAELDPELLAVLAAAAHTAIGRPVSIHRVHVHPLPALEAWSRAGRMDIMVSHRVEPKR